MAPRIRNRDEVSSTLLSAAEIVLREAGLEGLSVRKIALEADISTMNVYSRFGNLSGLLDELVLDGFDELRAALFSLAPTGDVVADLIGFSGVYRSWVLARPDQYRLMMTRWRAGAEPSAVVQDARRGLLDAITDRVAAARAARADDVARFSTQEAAMIVLSILHGAMLLELDGVIAADDSAAAWAERFGTAIRFGLRLPSDSAA